MKKNMQAMDHSQLIRKEHQRRMNAQNQNFLRLQIKQKEENLKRSMAEQKQHVNEWHATAPEENAHYVARADPFVRSQLKEAQKVQLE